MSRKDHVLRKVLVLYTGGTIGMTKNVHGAYTPSTNSFANKLRSMHEMNDEVMAEKYFGLNNANNFIISDVYKDYVIMYSIKEYDPLYDSSNMDSNDWIKIATDIEDNYAFYDGFVILHGTDTLVYTAAALSFMLDGLQKPVVITGAQIPIYENRTDATSNLLCALIFAGCFEIPEVCVYFANKLLRGNRTTKTSCSILDAFNSPNYHALAKFGINIKVYDYHILNPSGSTILTVHKNLNPNVVLFSLFPTITGSMMESFINPAVEGVVLLSYGSGNIPSRNKDLLNVLKMAVDRGVIIINVSQCPQGTVVPSYEAGRILKEIGVLIGYDMTPAAALTKLTVVLGFGNLSLAEKKQIISTNICGELTIPE